MVRASHLAANPETLASNAFQAAGTAPDAAARALREQAALGDALVEAGVDVVWLEPASDSPDGAFPNNWFSTHTDGTLAIYPMQAPSRRTEKIPDLAERLSDAGYRVDQVVDLSYYAERQCFLEGTGSLVLDRRARIAYACPSVRTDVDLAAEWARRFGYELCLFNAVDPNGRAVYHTNVVMSLGAGLAIVCLDAVADAAERERLAARLSESGNEILAIEWPQVRAFAGNQLFLAGRGGPVVALSAAADNALAAAQKRVLDAHARRIVADIATIETHGGGSVRCMLAEIFLPRA